MGAMIKSEILESFYKAWYDFRTDPDEDGVEDDYDSALSMILDELKKMGHPCSEVELRQSLRSGFRDWQKSEGLPKVGKK